MFLKLLRKSLGALVLFFDKINPPRAITRSAAEQARIDEETKSLVLYQFEACPFCVKVRRVIRELNLKIELRDALNHETAKKELIQGGGDYQVPCLRITQPDGTFQWMYESSDINQYLKQKFGTV